ncbi:MAG: AAA family ATPase [Bacilli bacterium]|nr:AAA family ATPase [Bacilli bacterium]
MDNSFFSWVHIYQNISNKLLDYKNNRRELIRIMYETLDELNLCNDGKGCNLDKYKGQRIRYDDIDPISFMNRFDLYSDKNRKAIIKKFQNKTGMAVDIPNDFYGIPSTNAQRSCVIRSKDDRDERDIDDIWNLFEAAIRYADNPNNELKEEFIKYYDIVLSKPYCSYNITIGLFKIRPNFYLNLDSTNRDYLNKKFNILIRECPKGRKYLELIDDIKTKTITSGNFDSLLDFSRLAWEAKKAEKNQQNSLVKSKEEKHSIINETNNSITKEKHEAYSSDSFLEEVYMNREKYNEIISVLKRKKNIILMGSPGVGKTFMAKRLAYSLMNSQNKDRIEFVQFHQSYSYEDFIEGFRPVIDKTGFEIELGIFYKFCKKAENDPNNDYYLIIDEINRGNLSKILGELLMLIENDKRGEQVTLLYSKSPFSVPSNIYIIGLMNTADRSLAILDYALRRRFSFINIFPAFNNETFKKYQLKVNNTYLNKTIEKIKELNKVIASDPSLGGGYTIGHSYFCELDADLDESDIKIIIKYDIIPLLEEYWFDDEKQLKEWKEKLLEA